MAGDYQKALEAAGAEILASNYFGSYQGDFIFKVRYNKEVFFIKESYGSCSGCDSYEAHFGWDDPSPKRLAAFGEEYLSNPKTYDELKADIEKASEWDSEAKDMLKWLEANKNEEI